MLPKDEICETRNHPQAREEDCICDSCAEESLPFCSQANYRYGRSRGDNQPTNINLALHDYLPLRPLDEQSSADRCSVFRAWNLPVHKPPGRSPGVFWSLPRFLAKHRSPYRLLWAWVSNGFCGHVRTFPWLHATFQNNFKDAITGFILSSWLCETHLTCGCDTGYFHVYSKKWTISIRINVGVLVSSRHQFQS